MKIFLIDLLILFIYKLITKFELFWIMLTAEHKLEAEKRLKSMSS